ncbi:alpha/beta hydrolase [Rhodophyticola sp. CCM32]|uniref:alpha/beta hydrolase n=1 Tax=Rhodophyticola sp. CCM32 TaxID=2916397 RepID=UPI00143E00E5|nr:alpha/beta hydrolase [Rhodophyticola sp. CCM32]
MFLALILLMAGLALLLGAVWVFGPTEPVLRSGPFIGDVRDPEAYYAAREAEFDDITPGTEARVIWAGDAGARTPLTLLYIHGFSATSEEIRPVPDDVAAALGANLVYPRLTGHGRPGFAMAEATAGDWIDDTAEALAVARAVGDRVLVIGTSTGATLAAIAMTEPDMAEGVAGVVMISANFRLANPAGVMLEWPAARLWVPWITGATRSFAIQNANHGRYWTTSYPTVAALPLAAMMRDARGRDYTGVSVPLLSIFAEQDQVISASAARGFAGGWGGAVTLAPQTLPEEGVDPYNHVIAGDILSPAMSASVTGQILDWVAAQGL